jgi:hypothetical protein
MTTLQKLFAGLLAVVTLFATLPPALTAWCSYAGFMCSYPRQPTSIIEAATTLGNNCTSNVDTPVCIGSTNNYYRLQSSTIEVVDAASGMSVAAKPTIGANDNGWHMKPDEVTPHKVCVRFFAHTTACEHQQKFRGKFSISERLTIF